MIYSNFQEYHIFAAVNADPSPLITALSMICRAEPVSKESKPNVTPLAWFLRFSNRSSRRVARIVARIQSDAPEERVAGVLYERRPPKTLPQRMTIWRKKNITK
jgi:hypothetical protein